MQMQSYELHIDHDGFTTVHRRLEFDTATYSELLAESVDPTEVRQLPTVTIQPHPAWVVAQQGVTRQSRRQLARSSSITADGIVMGTHLQGKDAADITVNVLPPSIDDPNTTLLHETRHWVDRQLGIPETRRDRLGKAAKGISGFGAVVLATGGSLVETYTHVADGLSMAVGGITAIATVIGGKKLGHRYGYTYHSYEVRAREFAANPAILHRYGRIITLSTLESQATP